MESKKSRELDNCGKTIKNVDRHVNYDNWTIEVFGGEIGIDITRNVDFIEIDEVTRIIKRMKIYGLVN